jgi:hypothetical protein
MCRRLQRRRGGHEASGVHRHSPRQLQRGQRGGGVRVDLLDRSAIVNLARIRELQPTFNGEYAVLLDSGAKLTLSRSYRDALRTRLGGEW